MYTQILKDGMVKELPFDVKTSGKIPFMFSYDEKKDVEITIDSVINSCMLSRQKRLEQLQKYV